jgi:cytochrome c biogenesis protein
LGAWGAQRGGRLPTSRFAQAFSDSDGDPQDEEPALETEDSELDPEPEDLKQPVHLEMEAQMPPHLRQAWKRTLNRLSSLPLALAEMGAIAGLSAVGTVLEQGETAAFYAEKYPSQVLGIPTSELIIFLGFDHMFSCPLFLLLSGLLAASLAACTSTRQLPMLQAAQRWRYLRKRPAYNSLPYARQVAKDLTTVATTLENNGYKVVVEDNTLYGFKGLFSRFAPIGVHFSLLLIIAGATVGGLCGAKGDVMIPEGQAFLLGPALTRAGPLAGKLLPQTVVNVNNFRIDYSDEGKIEQFYSDLSVLEGVLDNQEREVAREIIYVNKPLRYKGVGMNGIVPPPMGV